MIAALLLAGLVSGDPMLESLWRDGRAYEAFHDAARARRDAWDANTARANPPAELIERARAVPGTWKLLVVGVDGCSDSVSSLPHIAALAAAAGIELRIVDPGRGRGVMERNRTPDGRAATPTIVLLDEEFDQAGVWIERPAALQDWYIANKDALSQAELYAQKMAWYEADGGASSMREIVELLERAAQSAERSTT